MIATLKRARQRLALARAITHTAGMNTSAMDSRSRQTLQTIITSPAARTLAALGAAAVIWFYSSSALHDLLLVGAFFVALRQAPRGASVWSCPAGRLFLAVLIFTLLTLPLADQPGAAIRSLVKLLPVLLAVFALPVLFKTEHALWRLPAVSLAVLTPALAWDLLRLYRELGPDLLQQARFTRPYLMNHPNVASMMAAAAVFCAAALALRSRRLPIVMACGMAGIVNLLYLVVLRSRGPQLAFAACTVLPLVILPSRKAKAIWAALLLLLGLTAFAGFQILNPRFAEKDVATLNRRTTVWQHTVKLIREQPLLGYGYGKKIFREVYERTDPPKSPYDYPHPHNYWLKITFEGGVIGLALYIAAWSALFVRILRTVWTAPGLEQRLLPGLLLLLLALVHFYGLGDYPDSVVRHLQLLLIPMALTATGKLYASGSPLPAA